MPDNEQQSPAVDVLRRMGGMADHQAERYLEKCTPDEVALLEACENGKDYRAVVDGIADRLNQAKG
jgi:hypothetical protein